jgi:hypothetical protein
MESVPGQDSVSSKRKRKKFLIAYEYIVDRGYAPVAASDLPA